MMAKKTKTKTKISRKTPLDKILELGKSCKKCGHCCSHGSGALARGDLASIAKFLRMTEKEVKEKYLVEDEKFHTILLKPKLIKEAGKPYGKCIFLKLDNTCSINDVKPLQCRVGNCTENGEELNLWFMINYYLNENDPESVRQYAIYTKCGGKTLPGAELERLVDKKKLNQILNYEILR